MKRRVVLFLPAIGVIAGIAQTLWAATYVFEPAMVRRKVKVVRDYELTVAKDQVNVVTVPAMISFRGATNEQIIESSEFECSVQPQKVNVITQERGDLPWKGYSLVWENPGVDKIQLRETMVVNLTARNRLPTSAQLPYSKEVRSKYASYLEKDIYGAIDPNQPDFKAFAKTIRLKNAYAEDIVEAVCDWINTTVKYDGRTKGNPNQILAKKKAESLSLSRLACTMIRRYGIPCDVVHNKFISKNAGHYCIEVYYPDTGWVFYEICHRQRGFRALNCLIGLGWGCQVTAPGLKGKMANGYFSKEEDLFEYKEPAADPNQLIRKTPKETTQCVKVTHTAVPPKMPVRHESIRELLMSESYPPGDGKPGVKEAKKGRR